MKTISRKEIQTRVDDLLSSTLQAYAIESPSKSTKKILEKVSRKISKQLKREVKKLNARKTTSVSKKQGKLVEPKAA